MTGDETRNKNSLSPLASLNKTYRYQPAGETISDYLMLSKQEQLTILINLRRLATLILNNTAQKSSKKKFRVRISQSADSCKLRPPNGSPTNHSIRDYTY